MHDDQHTTGIPTTPIGQTQSPADETHQTEPQEQQPQLTIAVDSLNQNAITEDKRSKHDLMDDATFNLIRQKTPERQKPRRIALQILEQETKNDRVRYLMRWENPNAQRSWSWSDDVTEDLKKTFYKTHSLDGVPQIMSLDYTNRPTFNIQLRNGELMSH